MEAPRHGGHWTPGNERLLPAPPPAGRAPVSGKVANGGIGGLAVLLITWALSHFIPAWQSAIPAPLQSLLPGFAAVVAYYITAFSSKHQASTAEITDAVRKGGAVLAEVEAALYPATGGRP